VHGGRKLGMIKSTATGIEMDIDGFGRGSSLARVRPSGLSEDALPAWLRDQPPDDADQLMTKTDLNRLSHLAEHENTLNDLQNVFSQNPQGMID